MQTLNLFLPNNLEDLVELAAGVELVVGLLPLAVWGGGLCLVAVLEDLRVEDLSVGSVL